MHFRSKGQTTQGRHPSHRHPPADRTPSTAWLAAQAAFSAPEPAAGDAAIVTVRSSGAPEAVPETAPEQAAALPVVAERQARVFRVVAAPATEDQAPAAAPPADLPVTPSQPARPRRTRRVDAGKQPGPVTHIVHATSVEAEGTEAASEPRMTRGEEIDALWALMQRVNALLDDISRARNFRLLG